MRSIEISGQAKTEDLSYAASVLKERPTVTIITVVLNGAKDLNASMNSVKNLTYESIEYIVIDGGSKDETISIIKENESYIDHWVSEPDQGVYDAMNKDIEALHGDYILFLGADDVIHDVVDEFDRKAVNYYGDAILSKSLDEYGGKFYSLKLFMKNIFHQAFFCFKYIFDNYSFSLNSPVLHKTC